MSSIRQSLEKKLAAFADSRIPTLPIALEGVSFVKPNGPFLECFISSSGTVNTTVDGMFTRERGVFQVNVWCVSGKGMGEAEQIAEALIKAFPVVPEFGDVKITETGSKSRAILEISGFVIIPVTFKYRYEGVV